MGNRTWTKARSRDKEKRHYRLEFIVRNREYQSDSDEFFRRFEKQFSTELAISLRLAKGNYLSFLPRVHDVEFAIWLQAFWCKWGVIGPYLPRLTLDPICERNSINNQAERIHEMSNVNVSLGKLEGFWRDGLKVNLREVRISQLVNWIASRQEEERTAASRRFDAILEKFDNQSPLSDEISRAISDAFSLYHVTPKAIPVPKSEMKFHANHCASMLIAWDNFRRGGTFSELAEKLYPEDYERYKYTAGNEKNTVTERVRKHYSEAKKMIDMGFEEIRN